MFIKNKSFKLSRDEKRSGIPKAFHLEQNTPNPFSTQTTICFSVPRHCNIKIVVYCRREEPVSTLYDGKLSPGRYKIIWDGSDDKRRHLKTGDYVYFLETEDFVSSRKMTMKD